MAGVDAKNCSASGEGLLAATAGVEASFRVMCRSTQGELMDLPDDGRELTIKFTEKGRTGRQRVTWRFHGSLFHGGQNYQ